MLAESFLAWKRARRPWREIQLAVVLLNFGLLAGLVWLHPKMDAMIDLDKKMVHDKAEFYGVHRIYLWLSTFQWFAAWGWLPLTLRVWFADHNKPQQLTTNLNDRPKPEFEGSE